METVKMSFWGENKVFILGLLSAILMAIQPYAESGDIDWKIVGFGAFSAGLAYFSKEWRGQSTSIAGILAALGVVTATYQSTGQVNWLSLIIAGMLQYIASQSPDAKSRGYEHTDIIKAAKHDGEIIVPAKLTKKE